MAVLSPVAKQQFFANGLPAAGYKLYTYATGTSTPQAAYTDRAGSSAHTNPIILDAEGYVPSGLYLTDGVVYDYVLKTAADALVWTRPGVVGGLGERFTPADFGAIGDDTTDDYAALARLLTEAKLHSRTIDWGDASKVYRITEPLVQDLGAVGISWTASGATIRYDGDHAERVFDLSTAVGCPVVIEGVLTIDANSLANNAITIKNTADGSLDSHYQNVTITDLVTKNMLRADTTFLQSAEGIFVWGAWNRVVINRPVVKNSILAEGAEVLGSYGAMGITVSNVGTRSFRYCSIIDPDIENVSSEDPDYLSDQDGIRLFDGGESASRLYPWETFAQVRGGRFKNCRNRSIKIQANFGRVRDIACIRDDPPTGAVGSQAEIDMQVGGGSVDGVDCLYDGFVPTSVVKFTDTSITGKAIPACTAKNIRVINNGAVTLPIVVVVTADYTTAQRVVIDTIDVRGLVDKIVTWRIADMDDAVLVAKNVFASPTTAFGSMVRAVASVANNHLIADTCINLGTAVPFFIKDSAASSNIIISANNCVGWTPTSGAYDAGVLNQPALTRVTALASNNNAMSGALRPHYVLLADGASVQLPRSALVGNSGIIIATVGSNIAEDQAIFAVDHNSIVPIAVTGTTWVAGTTADPGSGSYRIWGSGLTTTGMWIKNASGSPRSITLFLFG